MSSAREVIAKRIAGESALAWADKVIDSLTAAGYRIIGPDELDDVTIDRCARIVERSAPNDTGKWCPYRAWALRSLPDILSLKGGRS